MGRVDASKEKKQENVGLSRIKESYGPGRMEDKLGVEEHSLACGGIEGECEFEWRGGFELTQWRKRKEENLRLT